MKTFLAALCLTSFTLISVAREPSSPLQCGSGGSIQATAERQLLSDQNIYNVQLTYFGKKPPSQEIDKTLRNCLSVAAKIDGTKDILATAWIRKHAADKPDDDDMINPYGGMKYISYKASDKSIEVRELQLKRK